MFDAHQSIKLGKGQNKIACLGDAHYGHPNHMSKQFAMADKEIWDNGYNVVTMGDMVECREPGHKFFVPGSPTINDQMNWYFDFLEKYADEDRLKGVLIGNHEHALINRTSNNEIERWCRQHKVNYMDYMGVLDFDYNGYTYSAVFHHGAGNGTSLGGQMNKLMGFTKYFTNHDAVIMAHTHQLAALPPNIQLYRDKKTHQEVDHYCFPAFTGSFFLTYKDGPSEYGEIKGYNPQPVGYVVLTLEDQMAQSQTRILRIK